MKKLIALLLIMMMSLLLLIGCGGTTDNGGDKNDSIKNEEEKDDDEENEENASGVVTIVYEATDYNNGTSMDCALTYDSGVVEIDNNLDEGEILNITDETAYFYHNEMNVYYDLMAIPMCPTAEEYYSIEKDTLEVSEKYTEVTVSELTTYMAGDIQTKEYTYTVVRNDDDESKTYAVWILEFENGVVVIESLNVEDKLSEAQEGLNDLLIGITLDGLEPIATKANDTTVDDNSGADEAFAWLPPQIEIDGVVYTFPMEAQELVDSGWVMDTFPVPARPGANAGIYFTKGDLELFTNVSSITGVEQPIEEGEVCSMGFSSEYNSNIPVSFPGGIKIGSTKAEVESALPSEYVYDANQQCFKYVYDDGTGQYDIKIYLTDDECAVEEISYTYWTR